MNQQVPAEDSLRAIWEQLNQDESHRQEQVLERLLQQRAQQYAVRGEAQQELQADTEQVLIFTLYGERYAIPVETVRGVRPLEQLTRVPGVPRFYRGVVNVRGKVVSVLDLHAFFRIASSKEEAPAELVLVEASGLFLGLLATRVESIQIISTGQIQPLLELPYARGLIDGSTTLLDLAGLFTDTSLIVGTRSEG